MSSVEEENKAVILKMYEGQNNRDFGIYFKYMSPDCVFHTNLGDIRERPGEGSEFFTAFPDVTNTIDEIVAERDKVAFQVTYGGTHKGEFLGIAPTGKQIKMTNTAIYRIVDGKVVEGSSTLDMLGLLRQIGGIPAS